MFQLLIFLEKDMQRRDNKERISKMKDDIKE
jgi:hypothetical protein